MADESRAIRQRLLGMVNGFMLSQALYAFTVLGLADLIADGRRVAADLAAAVNADPTAINRLLRALAAAGPANALQICDTVWVVLAVGLKRPSLGERLADWRCRRSDSSRE